MLNIPDKLVGTREGAIYDLIVNYEITSAKEIMKATGVTKANFKSALLNLEKLGYLEVSDYKNFQIQKLGGEPNKSGLYLDEIKDLINNLTRKEMSPSIETHFLSDGTLTTLINQLLQISKSSITIINPYVIDGRLIQGVLNASKECEIKIITRDPNSYYKNLQNKAEKTHQVFKENGIELLYNSKLHSKINIFDKKIVTISSLNFFLRSQEETLEAGILSYESQLVKDVILYYNQLRYSSTEFSNYFQ